MQTEITLLGCISRVMGKHPESELRCCHTKAQALRVALIYSGYSQDVVAERIGVTAGYLSMILSGKRRITDDIQRKFMRVTGSLAPLQWDAMQEGVELYVDPVRQQLAYHERCAEDLRIQRAA